jgi:hypothetical protein
MADDPKPDTTGTILCSECQEILEVSDAIAILRAAHLSTFCPGTEGILHG